MTQNLILQGLGIVPDAIRTIAALAGAQSVDAITPSACRCTDVRVDEQVKAGIDAAAYASELDYALIDSSRTLSGFKLLAMDMDSTLITIECIDEIADMQGLKPQVAAITEAAMRGEIAFRESLT